MIDWILANPTISLAALGVFLDLILGILIFLRKSKVSTKDDVKLLIDDALPGLINVAEASELDGPYKLGAVIDLVLRRIRKYIKKTDETYWISYVKDKVEAILSTPQKKEK